jgi:uncharacterized membrane protein (UPF0127 family)
MRFPQAATLHTGPSAAPLRHALCLRVARNTWTRFRGLMLAAPLATEPRTQGLLITRCAGVHGFFMRYAIDVVYLSKALTDARQDAAHYTVTQTASLKPWRISVGRGSAHVLELPAGSIQRLQIQAGDELVTHP